MRNTGLTALWRIAAWVRGLLAPRVTEDDVRRQDFRTQTRGMGLRLTEFARDRLRGRWLRLRRNDE